MVNESNLRLPGFGLASQHFAEIIANLGSARTAFAIKMSWRENVEKPAICM